MTHEQLTEIEQRAEAATVGPWTAGGPVKRESIVKRLTGGRGPNGLTEKVWEIGPTGEMFPPGICVVNNFYHAETQERTPAEQNAEFIAAARQDIPALCAALREAWDRIEQLESSAWDKAD